MNFKQLLVLATILISACSTHPPKNTTDTRVGKAKWYFYAYALPNKAYTASFKEINPLECEIRTKAIKQIGVDTTCVFFNLFQKEDTAYSCTLKPEQLVGINIVRDSIFLPVYHYFMYDPEPDSSSLAFMFRSERDLKLALSKPNLQLGSWLMENKGVYIKSKP